MVEVLNLTKQRIPVSFVRELAKRVLAGEKKSDKDLSITFIGETRSKSLNETYRGKAKSANVLSFPIPELGLGEIFLCMNVIRKDARRYGITERNAVAWMVTHGILHLAGYDHVGSEREARNMEAREEHYLSTKIPGTHNH